MKNNLPVILLKGLVLLPLSEARIELNNDITKKVIDLSRNKYNNKVLIVSPIEALEEAPDTSDLAKCGVIATISSRIDLPNGLTRIVLMGESRVKVLNYKNISNDKNILEAEIVSFPKFDYNPTIETALFRKLMELLEIYISKNSFISNSIINQIKNIDDLEKLTDYIANFLPLSISKKITLMVESNRIIRAKNLINELNVEIAVLDLENKIETTLKHDLDDMQKEMILREKIKVIKEELGEKDSKSEYIDEVNRNLEEKKLPFNIVNRIKNELKRFETTNDNSPEFSTIRSYIDTVLSIPFNEEKKEAPSLNKVKECLEISHYGLEEVKNRILEYVAVSTNKNANTPILCLVGPPGVGKTTLAESIAKALDKSYAKISLGGMNDPAELIGHRKTYIGSEPGKIITSLIRSKSLRGVLLLDEIDKVSSDYKGDPVSVLLDLLDKNQAKAFTDNYIEESIDLSKITFILTANDASLIPPVLLDRLEIINLPSYLTHEKETIAKKYLIKNALKNAGLKDGSINFEEAAIKYIIERYTKEAGVRDLDRLLNRVIRKVVTYAKLNNIKVKDFTVKESDIHNYLGIEKYEIKKSKKFTSGYVRGLAYTPYGGELLDIEVASYQGKTPYVTSGHLGDVLKESIDVAFGYIKSNTSFFKINDSAFKETIHINFREGGIPKDGPSAGIDITTALLSYLLNIPIEPTISMSGEITLLGDVLPVGGLREKVLAAKRNGIRTIFLSKENEKDINELPEEAKKGIEFIYVINYKEIYLYLFGGKNERNKKNWIY